jgi:hypothetical protein
MHEAGKRGNKKQGQPREFYWEGTGVGTGTGTVKKICWNPETEPEPRHYGTVLLATMD